MKNEREIAELIFDKFRQTNSKVNHVVTIRTIRFGLIDKLNPKEQELFDKVFIGLQALDYFTYEKGGLESIRLTQKGYDYIYDDEQVEIIAQKPWLIPEFEKTDWDKAYNRLWRIIGPQEGAIHYIGGSQFYKFVFDLCNDIPPTYSEYIERRRKHNLSTSRSVYYKDLIDHLDAEKRFELYVNIQLSIEQDSIQIATEKDDLDFSFFDTPAPTPAVKDNVVEEEATPVIPVGADNDETPTVFISYSWDTDKHEEWVLNLATKLMENGVNVILDKWDLGSLGNPLPNFMEKAIAKSNRVICVMTPNYKKKTEKSEGGVGYEYSIITAEIFADGVNTSKFIPLIRQGAENESVPTALRGRKYVDMRKDAEFEDKFVHELLRDIHNAPKYKKPALGAKPKFD
ncbi:SEFIR Domain-Containing Protein [Bacteroidales bacterium CF]|jgi:SEFIR domain.|nr:SEFIR Domain-Containing Protein [Bacteroidales bacterium CF]